MLDPVIVTTISIGLGLMFLLAGIHKFANGAEFRITLLEYQLLPEALVAPASHVIPMVEVMLGGAWLLGWVVGGVTAIGSATLLGVYALAIGVNLVRGRVHFDCGCGFGGKTDSEQYLSGGLVIRNVVLAALALVTLLPLASRPLGFLDYATLVAALLAAVLLFAAANQLLTNRAAINTWRKPND